MPQLALGNGPTWGAIGFVAVRAVELLLREQQPQSSTVVACPAPAAAPAVEDWRLAVCEARLDAASTCSAPRPAPAEPEEADWSFAYGGAATAAGSLITVLAQFVVSGCRHCCVKKVAAEDAADERNEVHHRAKHRRRLAGIVV